MRVVIGQGSCGIASGADKVAREFELQLEQAAPHNFQIKKSGCLGNCYLEPIVDVYADDGQLVARYCRVNVEDVRRIVSEHLVGGRVVADLLIAATDEDFLARQQRIVLRNVGLIDPEAIEDYLGRGGYQALSKALSLGGDEVIAELKTANLRGRGGAGFPTWFKWDAAAKATSPSGQKYIVCNADEGDPGAFMDRAVLEGDPHAVLEGMIIGGYTIGASEGVIYVRAEYPLAIKRLQIAIAQAEAAGYLGSHILGSEFSFTIRIKAGAGAFVCGEETALIASLEGERGMPRLRPPFPAQKGLWQQPTNINNVETYANVAYIIARDGAAFAAIGGERSSGTKVFALAGKIKRGGLVEVPMGMPLHEIIYGIGAGIRDDLRLKAVQMGGPSGGCIPAELVNTPVDYEHITATGAIIGSGGMIVMDENSCMVDMARYFLDFICKESCGKCNYCRVGTKRMLEILQCICDGEGRVGDIELLEELAAKIKDGSLCGLGQTAPNPVLTTIKYFREEYEDHIANKHCTAHYCRPLLRFEISEACTGCTVCARHCPVGAISGERKGQHLIDQALCTKCGKCLEKCKFAAVLKD